MERIARVGVSVSKKVSKKAVVRNRTRRRAYAALAPLLALSSEEALPHLGQARSRKAQGRDSKEELAELLKKG
jgi:ribonuclease P protein component